MKPNLRNLRGQIRALQYRDPAVRLKAAQALGGKNDPRAIMPLLKALKDKDHRMRLACVWALAGIKDPRVIKALIFALHDEESAVRKSAVDRLGGSANPMAEEPLIEIFQAGLCPKTAIIEAVRRIRVGSGIRSRNGLEFLTRALLDDDPAVRAAAADALGTESDAPIDALIQAQSDHAPIVRLAALKTLGFKDPSLLLDAVNKALEDDDEAIRRAARQLLIDKLADPAEGYLFELVKNSTQKEGHVDILGEALKPYHAERVREHAAQALGSIASPEAIDVLIAAYVGEAISLYDFPKPVLKKARASNIETLLQILRTGEGRRPERALDMLTMIDSFCDIDALFRTLESHRPLVRAAISNALPRILDRTPKTAALHEYLVRALANQNDLVRIQAAHALGKIGYHQAVEDLARLIADPNPDIRAAAVAALGTLGANNAFPSLVRATRDEDGHVRSQAVSALGTLGNPDAAEVLIAALNDEDDRVAAEAAKSLGNLKSEAAVNILIDMLDHRGLVVEEAAAEALGNLGDRRAVDALARVLKGESAGFRRNAALALGRIGDRKSVSDVIDFLFRHPGPWGTYGLPAVSALANLFGDYSAIIMGVVEYSYSVSQRTVGREDPATLYTQTVSDLTLKKLCAVRTPASNNILHKVATMADSEETITHSENLRGPISGKLSLESFRQIAKKELKERGNPVYDPSVDMDENAWKWHST